jgi:CDP-diacylglycerol--serine O-phosphatidyltransferase
MAPDPTGRDARGKWAGRGSRSGRFEPKSGYPGTPAGRAAESRPEIRALRRIHLLPNLLTLANAFCGLLALMKGIDALAFAGAEAPDFYAKIATACWLVFLGMLFDAVDGKVARMVGGASSFGAQLDSFSDMITFGLAPAFLVKVLIEHEGPLFASWGNPWDNPRIHFVAAAMFSVMAMLRLARFNLETDADASAHKTFSGLPSPGAAGAVCATMLMYLSLRNPAIERSDGTLTPLGAILRWFPQIDKNPSLFVFLPVLALLLPCLGLLMVSRVRYTHMFSALTGRGQFVTLVSVVFAAFFLYVTPVLAVFVVFNGYVLIGLAKAVFRRGPPRNREERAVQAGAFRDFALRDLDET